MVFIITPFQDEGSPATGLSPTIRIRAVSDGVLIVTDDAMPEIGDGMYRYDFVDFSGSIEYSIRADGGGTLADQDRFVFGGNETLAVTESTLTGSLGAGVWDAQTNLHEEAGSFGQKVGKKLLTFIKFIATKDA